MIQISAHNLSKSFGARPLFENISFVIESGERIGLIGPNGAGKSTLLKILAGLEKTDSGTLSPARGLRVGYLAQVPLFTEGATIYSTLYEGAASTAAHEEEWEVMARIEELMSKLDLNRKFTPETPVDKLSGGWKKRVALARELVAKPDLLLLDEPTNHLDVESILWLEELISRADYTTVTITHDRQFLQRIANRILELDRRNEGGLLSVRGDYTKYLEVKDDLMVAQERREVVLKNTLRRETEWLRRGAKARQTKQEARIARHGELTETVEDLTSRNQKRTVRIDFGSTEKNPKRLIEAQSISKAYGDRLLFKNQDIFLGPGSRLGLLGVNGCGKSTLIRVLLGQEESDSGKIIRADNLSVAYFEQNRETLDPETTLADTVCPRGDFVDYRNSKIHVRGYLDRFLFTKEQMTMPVQQLSGGEQSRLLLAKLMLRPANVLVLDEPTNDLDMATLNVLEECLIDFPGAVLLVSHDRYFLDQVSTQLLAFEQTGTTFYADLSQWENSISKNAQSQFTENSKKEAPANAKNTAKKKLTYNEQRELSSMESEIHKAETKLTELTSESVVNATKASRLAEISKQMSDTQSHIEKLYARWEELSAISKD